MIGLKLLVLLHFVHINKRFGWVRLENIEHLNELVEGSLQLRVVFEISGDFLNVEESFINQFTHDSLSIVIVFFGNDVPFFET